MPIGKLISIFIVGNTGGKVVMALFRRCSILSGKMELDIKFVPIGKIESGLFVEFANGIENDYLRFAALIKKFNIESYKSPPTS